MELSSDNTIMLQVKSGEIDKLGLLFERYKKPLFGYFFKTIHDKETSEDLVQNVFYRILKYRSKFAGHGKFTNWMYRIAHNVSVDHFRKNKHNQNTEEITDIDLKYLKTEGDKIKENDESQQLAQALQLLNSEEKEVLVLSKYQGLKYKEIGEIIGCTEGAVKAKVFRAIMALKHIYLKLDE
jgi:RNA polymerase sigma-70 factor (ECF subfamily)